MSNRTLNISDDIYSYMNNNSIKKVKAQKVLRKFTSKMNAGNMRISAEQG